MKKILALAAIATVGLSSLAFGQDKMAGHKMAGHKMMAKHHMMSKKHHMMAKKHHMMKKHSMMTKGGLKNMKMRAKMGGGGK